MFQQLVLASGLMFAGQGSAATIEILTGPVYACGTMDIAFSDFPVTATAKGNWIAVAEAGAPRSYHTFRQKYLPVGSDGTVNLSALGLIPFKPYELRAFLDWEATRSYEIADKVEFFVLPQPGCEPAMLTRVPGSVAAGDALEFNFQNLQLTDSNWVSIARPEDVAWKFEKQTYLPKKKAGRFSFPTAGLVPGTYELRLFQNWKENKDYFIYSRVTFRVD
jgi:hypothetical protein